MVNFGPLAADIGPVVWGTPANFNGFRLLAALLHGTPVLGVSQTLRRSTEGATYIRQGGHHVGHWPIFKLAIFMVAQCNRADHYIFALWFLLLSSLFPSPNLSYRRLDVCHTSTHDLGANLRCRSETCCRRIPENTGRKKLPKIAVWAPSHNFVGLYLCH